MMRRVVLLVLDGVGVGALPDAAEYGDEGSNSLANTATAVGGLTLPFLESLGLGNIVPILGVAATSSARGCWSKMSEMSRGKDSVVGHWELAGIYSPRPQPVYPRGFPPNIIQEFVRVSGIGGVLGNKPASGTVIIEELGGEHVRTRWPIVYTSADSVFQIAAHEEIVPLPTLYRWCELARRLLRGEHAVGRVIARPFTGQPGSFRRTANRHDWALPPPHPNLLDSVGRAGLEVVAVGKINDLFSGEGITKAIPAHDNTEALDGAEQAIRTMGTGLLFVNCIEFDQVFGHRNDAAGYARALARVDERLPVLFELLAEDDVLMIVGDHGVDPTTPSTDHSREFSPLLVAGPRVYRGRSLGVRSSFADAGQTVTQLLKTAPLALGRGFAAEILTDA
ncbi:MAG: phosphopentomutase [Chloroflexi bacterium]|nr:phosphopentomutase [Chloroflexota bacterium]